MEESFNLKVHSHQYLITAGFSEEDQFQAVFKVVHIDSNESGVEMGEITMNEDGSWIWIHSGEWTQLSQDIGEAIESRDM